MVGTSILYCILNIFKVKIVNTAGIQELVLAEELILVVEKS